MPRPDFYKLDSFTRQYIVTALWSTNDESDPETGGNPLDENYDHTNISDDTLEMMVADCRRFQDENAADVEAAAGEYDVTDGTDGYSYAGHDFWLNRNGHGAGFWDGDLSKELGERLDAAADKFGEFHLYVGDDGNISH
jgi:hypothetical protein